MRFGAPSIRATGTALIATTLARAENKLAGQLSTAGFTSATITNYHRFIYEVQRAVETLKVQNPDCDHDLEPDDSVLA